MTASPRSEARDGSPALLLSPPVSVSDVRSWCFRVSYMMYGTHMGSLSVYRYGVDSSRQRLWETFGNSGPKWHMTELYIVNQTSDFQLGFMSEQGYSGNSVALQYTLLYPGGCTYVHMGKIHVI